MMWEYMVENCNNGVKVLSVFILEACEITLLTVSFAMKNLKISFNSLLKK